MKKLCIALLIAGMSFSVNAQDVQPEPMNDLTKLTIDSEMMRSPVNTKKAYRQMKQVDRAASKRQEMYLAKQKQEKEWDDAKTDEERTRVKGMRPADFGMADVNLADKSGQINSDPVQSFYDMTTGIKTGGYGATADEIRATRAADNAALRSQVGGLTDEEYDTVMAETKGTKKAFGAKSINVTPTQMKR